MILEAISVRYVFVGFFICSVLLQLYLSIRLSRKVLKSRQAVPDDFTHNVELSEHQKAADYTLAKQRLNRYEILYQALLLLGFTLGGGLNVLANIAQKFSNNDIFQGIALIILFVIISSILALPFTLYKSFKLEERFGFNKMTMKTFIQDQIKGFILLILIGVPVLFVIIYLMGAMGEFWWLYVWLFWLLFSLTLMWAFPKWIAPIFNKFNPLEDGDLKTKIENLLSRTGFKSNGIFVMDGSKRSGHGNAYFTGLGQNKRIVFFDTLLKDMNDDEIEAVLAHELGHFKRRHIIKQMVLSFALVLVVFFILGLLINQSGFYMGLGVATQYASYAMAILLFFLVLPIFTYIFSPLGSILSRKNEYEADAYAAEVASAENLISALTKLYRSNAASLVTDPWYSLFYDSHPHASQRIAALKAYIK